MRSIAAMRSTAAVALMAASLAAQAKPSFAGKWVLENASNGRDGLGRELTIIQDTNILTIEYMTVGDNPTPRKLVYRLDGTESINRITDRGGQAVETSKATWKVNTLVITTTRASGEHQRTFSLESGNLAVGASTSGFGPMPTRIVYKKGT